MSADVSRTRSPIFYTNMIKTTKSIQAEGTWKINLIGLSHTIRSQSHTFRLTSLADSCWRIIFRSSYETRPHYVYCQPVPSRGGSWKSWCLCLLETCNVDIWKFWQTLVFCWPDHKRSDSYHALRGPVWSFHKILPSSLGDCGRRRVVESAW